MNYDKTRVEVINFLAGYGGISFVEFKIIGEDHVRILSTKSFFTRYGKDT